MARDRAARFKVEDTVRLHLHIRLRTLNMRTESCRSALVCV